MRKSILLTGASGTVGKEVLHQLLAQGGYDVTVFSRYSLLNGKALAPYRKQINIVYGDLLRREEVEQLTGPFDVAIHLAAVIPPLADEAPELAKAVNVQGTQHLIEVLERINPGVFFMYSSSIAVYGDRLNAPDIRVGDPLSPSLDDAYAPTKIRAEEIIRNSKLDWTVFRLTAIMGAQNHKLSKLMFHVPLDTSLEIATPQDAARAFVHGIEKKVQLSGRIFNLGGGVSCRTTYQRFLARAFELYGLGKLDFHPKAFAERNFHCGNYADGDELEKIVHFRRQNLDDYFAMLQKSVPATQKALTYPLRSVIKYFLARQSEPLRAFRENDPEGMKRFFGPAGSLVDRPDRKP